MGLEAQCKASQGKGRLVDVKAMLEGDHILVRSPELRLKIAVADLRKVEASPNGILTLDSGDGGSVYLYLGSEADAGKWARKILHPPTRMDKLGMKPGTRVFAEGEFDRPFHHELEQVPTEKAPSADLLLCVAETREQLPRAVQLGRAMQSRAAIWVVYPKGVDRIRQEDVFEAMRGAGLVDTKVCGFSATHTALRFTHPKSAPKAKTAPKAKPADNSKPLK